MKKTSIWILFFFAVLTLCACTAVPDGKPESTDTLEASEEADDLTTGDAALDNPRNQDGIAARELLAVSFGTSYNDARRASIGAIENALEAAFPGWSVRRGFTSQIVLNHVARRDGVSMDNVGAALDRAKANGVRVLVVQPTHLMDGFEYHDLAAEVERYADAFAAVRIGAPLLTSDEDFARVARAIRTSTAEYDDGETAVCLMGHGTEAASNAVYGRMIEEFSRQGMEHYYLATVEAEPSLNDLLEEVRSGGYTRVVLLPLMIVAGDHASRDMAGDEPESWKRTFEAAGYAVTCVLRGLGELPEIREIFVDHARAAMEGLPDTDETADNTESAAPDSAGTDSAPDSGSGGAANTDSASDGTSNAGGDSLIPAGLSPVYGDSLKEGSWPIDVVSSSSMFRVTACTLTVSGGTLTAELTMGGTGYLYVYPGTGAEAEAASKSDRIPFNENSDGAHTFTIPVSALDEAVPCAAYSKNREQWYDRTLWFRADSLPPEAFQADVKPEGGAAEINLADGTYTAEVTLTGGTGRASVASPAILTVQGGVCTAELRWNSPNYDYMVADGQRYEPVNGEGNSVFQIPVAAFDRPLMVIADTVAMSQPHEIEYALTFHSSTLQEGE